MSPTVVVAHGYGQCIAISQAHVATVGKAARGTLNPREETVLAAPTIEEAHTLLERARILREPADFDLLVFFARHPRTLLPSESLGALLGYELKDIARSLEALLECGLLKRTQTSAHAARLYVFAADAPHEWLPPLLKMAATRTGRVALRHVLANGPRSSNTEDAARAGQRSVLLRIFSDTHGEQRSDAKVR